MNGDLLQKMFDHLSEPLRTATLLQFEVDDEVRAAMASRLLQLQGYTADAPTHDAEAHEARRPSVAPRRPAPMQPEREPAPAV